MRGTTTPELDERHITERFVRASGPGGQNVNKVATAVELSFDLRGSSLPDAVKNRLIAIAGHRMRADGRLVIDSQAFRTQLQNREAARERLEALIERATIPPKRRKPTRPKMAAKERRLTGKKQRGAVKALRARTESRDD
jgi:ribosome-associated protein